MFESEQIRADIRSDLEDALSKVTELAATDDVESPSYDWCERLRDAIRHALDML